jgi:hypothetical protein
VGEWESGKGVDGVERRTCASVDCKLQRIFYFERKFINYSCQFHKLRHQPSRTESGPELER